MCGLVWFCLFFVHWLCLVDVRLDRCTWCIHHVARTPSQRSSLDRQWKISMRRVFQFPNHLFYFHVSRTAIAKHPVSLTTNRTIFLECLLRIASPFLISTFKNERDPSSTVTPGLKMTGQRTADFWTSSCERLLPMPEYPPIPTLSSSSMFVYLSIPQSISPDFATLESVFLV